MIDEAIYHQYLSDLMSGDRRRCAEAVSHLLENGMEVEALYTDVFQRSLYRIGELWEQNRISVAVEHLATAITEHLLSRVYPRILSEKTRNGRKAVISCSVNEYHQVGARMAADVMERRGWDTWFLGANTPVEDLLVMIQEKTPDVLGLSISIYFNMASLVKTIEIVRTNYPGLDIFIGGQALRWGGAEEIKQFANTVCIPSLPALIQVIGPEANK